MQFNIVFFKKKIIYYLYLLSIIVSTTQAKNKIWKTD